MCIYTLKMTYMNKMGKKQIHRGYPDQVPTINVRTYGEIIEMERIVNLHIQKLPEGVYLATSDSINGLVAQGRTIAETIEIARDVARKLIEAHEEGLAEGREQKAKIRKKKEGR
jgi:predicted RNase H-like HicB family nuclease